MKIGKYIIDRFEEEYIVLEDENMNTLSVPREMLPNHVNEGDHLEFDGEGFNVDEVSRKLAEKSIKNRFGRLKKKN